MGAISLDLDAFRRHLAAEKPLLVDYWAPWCGYCRRIALAYDAIAGEYAGALTAGKINIDEEPSLARAQKIDVIPTLVLYRGGEAVGRVTAPESRAAIERFLADALN